MRLRAPASIPRYTRKRRSGRSSSTGFRLFFIALGRVFDEDRDAHSVRKFIDATKTYKGFFSTSVLEAREIPRATEGVFVARAEGLQAIALAGDNAAGAPTGVLVGFDAPALNDNDELAFVATVRRGRDILDVLYFWNGRRLQRTVAEGDRLLRIGGAMDKIGEPALNNNGVIAFCEAILKGPPGARRYVRCGYARSAFVSRSRRPGARWGNGPTILPASGDRRRRRDRLRRLPRHRLRHARGGVADRAGRPGRDRRRGNTCAGRRSLCGVRSLAFSGSRRRDGFHRPQSPRRRPAVQGLHRWAKRCGNARTSVVSRSMRSPWRGRAPP
jgi:hypothetical protein